GTWSESGLEQRPNRDRRAAPQALDRGDPAEHGDRAGAGAGAPSERIVARVRVEEQPLQHGISAEMAAGKMRHLDALDAIEVAHQQHLVVLGCLAPGLALALADLDAPLPAVEGQLVALDRHEGVERIAHLDAVLVEDGGAHRVGDVDLLAEDAGIAQVAVLAGRLLVEEVEPGAGADVEMIVAAFGVRAGPAARTAEGSVAPVMAQRAAG